MIRVDPNGLVPVEKLTDGILTYFLIQFNELKNIKFSELLCLFTDTIYWFIV